MQDQNQNNLSKNSLGEEKSGPAGREVFPSENQSPTGGASSPGENASVSPQLVSSENESCFQCGKTFKENEGRYRIGSTITYCEEHGKFLEEKKVGDENESENQATD